jgi:aryl-alcohol dehydrogenase-like predicted oxidoreductase
MAILGPLEPWPGELMLPAAAEHGVRVITRVVDYGGLLWGGLVSAADLGERDHRSFRPAGWIEEGRRRIERMRPIGERHGLTTLQLGCQWNLAHGPVACTVPTLIQEKGAYARPIEDQRAELAATPAEPLLTETELEEIRAIGDNSGRMALKGAAPDHEGDERPDRWPLTPDLVEAGARWGIEPDRDLSFLQPSPSARA